MIICLLVVLLVASSAAAGFCFGIIRTLCTLFGLVLGAILAFPLGHYFYPVAGLVGLKNPVFVWAAGALIAFCLVVIVFKIIGFVAQKKLNHYYKYKAGDLRMGLWQRLNVRLGLCLGLVNGAIYAVLISLVICVPSYATTQLVIGDNATRSLKTLNLLGRQAQACGMSKIVAALDPMPPEYYTAADIVGLVYHNDLLEARLSRYPAYLALGERPEFQAVADDKAFTELRQGQPSFQEILSQPSAQAIVGNPDLLKEIWGLTLPNLHDLDAYLRTGLSARYDSEKILGRWSFNPNGTLELVKNSSPNLLPVAMLRQKLTVQYGFPKTTLIAAPGGELIVKNFGEVTFPVPPTPAAPAAVPVAPPAPIAPPPPAPAAAGGRGGRGGRGGGATPAAAPAGNRRGPTSPAAARAAAPPAAKPVPPTVTIQPKLEGHWTADGDKYQISITENGAPASWQASVDGDKLTITGYKLPLRFDRDF